jgi:hypothetical protein
MAIVTGSGSEVVDDDTPPCARELATESITKKKTATVRVTWPLIGLAPF